ncbi:hypothetical protein SUGI_0782410 [Cryptomeria japonica]|nr:hypothetical protein SUGI_0782410 [Cryptomeria japonica]
MRLLTGLSHHTGFSFRPDTLTAVGDKVFVEGYLGESLYWVHVWTVENGIATEVREYFNTSLVVTDFNPPSSSSGKSSVCRPLWQSELGKSDGESMPGLVLAI